MSKAREKCKQKVSEKQTSQEKLPKEKDEEFRQITLHRPPNQKTKGLSLNENVQKISTKFQMIKYKITETDEKKLTELYYRGEKPLQELNNNNKI